MPPKNKWTEVKDAFAAFCETIAALRDKDDGCPWDLQQNHETLRRYMIEEAYEAADAMAKGDSKAVCEELGDVLLQVVLNAQIGSDEKEFELLDVIDAVNKKMRRRHPHVFDKVKGTDTPEKVRVQWDVLKAKEKKAGDVGDIFAKAKHGNFPATMQALEIGKIAHRIKFDWDKPEEVKKQFASEVDELFEALKDAKYNTSAEVKAELGDVYFTLAQLCRHLGIDPEVTALDGNRKFLKRFGKMEKLAKKKKIDIKKAPTKLLEELWVLAKK